MYPRMPFTVVDVGAWGLFSAYTLCTLLFWHTFLNIFHPPIRFRHPAFKYYVCIEGGTFPCTATMDYFLGWNFPPRYRMPFGKFRFKSFVQMDGLSRPATSIPMPCQQPLSPSIVTYWASKLEQFSWNKALV